MAHSVDMATLSDNKTFCEFWSVGFSNLAGHCHSSAWVLTGTFHEDESMASTAMLEADRVQTCFYFIDKLASLNICKVI